MSYLEENTIQCQFYVSVIYYKCLFFLAPYNPESPVLESSLTFYWVMPPPEQRPTEYRRPLLLQYNMVHDSHLSTHAMEQIKKSIKYYMTYTDDSFVNFKDNYKPDITFLDKLKCTLTPKFPREQSDGLLWHFIRDELGCSSENDDKMDLDALLAVPQVIPASKPSQSSSSNFPSVSTLQQMVSRPPGVPPINVSSAIGPVSPHKFETPPLNIPVLSSTAKPSKSTTSSLPPSYPTGLDMLTSMALGLSSPNMPLPLGSTSLESLAAANSMLTGFSPGMSPNLASSLSSSKLSDLPSYAASLQSLSSNMVNFEKTSTSTSTSCTTSVAPIPANIASNLMMSSADIANALFSASKYSSAGILGIPDPMSKSTLAANNMFLSPSLLKMQESLLKPLSSSSPMPSKVGLDQNMIMKSPHDLIKSSSKDYLPPDFGSIGKGKDTSLDSMKHSELSVSKESSQSILSESQSTDYSQLGTSPRIGADPFLNQMLELTKKTTLPDYVKDFSQNRKINEEEMQKNPPSSLSYSSAASIADTIAQVAMGNFGKMDEVVDYSKSQDYSNPKTLINENDNNH